MPADTGRVSISRLSSDTEEQKQVLQETGIFLALQIKWLSANDTPLSSSKDTPLMLDSLHFKVHKKLDLLTGLVKFFFTVT